MKIIQTTLTRKWFRSALLLLCALVLLQCKDEEPPAQQVTVDGKTINLGNAKIYLTYEDTYNNYTYRDYFISDGVPKNDSPWSLDDYTNATYVIAIELATKSVDGFSEGTFQSMEDWSTATADNISNIYYEIAIAGAAPLQYDTPEDPLSPIVNVTGKFNGDDMMTLNFIGNLMDVATAELVATNFYFSGKVVDQR